MDHRHPHQHRQEDRPEEGEPEIVVYAENKYKNKRVYSKGTVIEDREISTEGMSVRIVVPFIMMLMVVSYHPWE